jgi:hypothetical protein
VRKLGYAPAMATIQLTQGDDHEIVLYMRPLATDLEPFVITEKSGYGRDQTIYDELERRKRYQSFQTRLLGPDDLTNYYGRSLGEALIKMGLYRPSQERSTRPTSISGPSRRDNSLDIDNQNACILINGKDPVVRPLSSFSTDEMEMLEVYPPGTELSGTVSWHFHQNGCTTMSLFYHPWYFVVWTKDR